MPHFRVDDALHSHPKAQRAGDEALGMWSRAGSFCMSYLTDGFVPDWWVKQQPKGVAKAKRLVAAGLWLDGAERDGEKGWQFHEFTGVGRQDSRAQILAEREKWRKKKAAQRGDTSGESLPESPMESRGESPRDTRGESRGESPYVRATPARTNPTQPNEEISGHLPETASQSDANGGIAATPAAELVRAVIPRDIPAATQTALRHQASSLLHGGTPPGVVEESLQDWLAKTGVGPGILPSLAADVIKRRNGHAVNGSRGQPESKMRTAAMLAAEVRAEENTQLATAATKELR